MARLLLYRELRHKTLVVNERKDRTRESKKANRDNANSETRGHPDVLCVVRGIR